MVKRLVCYFSFVSLLFIMIVGCTEKKEYAGDDITNHNYYDNTTKNSSRTNLTKPLVYESTVECWIVGLDGNLVKCPGM